MKNFIKNLFCKDISTESKIIMNENKEIEEIQTNAKVEQNQNPPKPTQKDQFNYIIEFAKTLEKENPLALFDLVRVLIKPYQSMFLVNAIKNKNHTTPHLHSYHFFMPNSNYDLQTTTNHPKLNPDDFLVNLSKDPVLPWPCVIENYISRLKLIGKDKFLGEWQYDKTNHYVTIWQPWGIVFVEGGNHSIATGIINAEGVLPPFAVYDMSSLLNEVMCDGDNYISLKTNEILAPVSSVEIGAIFEIGRLIKKHNMLPMHK